MLPITLLNAAQGRDISVECKSGRHYEGKMQACDLFMNITLENAKCVNASEDDEEKEFSELYLRGYSIKYLKVPDELLTDIIEERQLKREERKSEGLVSVGNGRRESKRR